MTDRPASRRSVVDTIPLPPEPQPDPSPEPPTPAVDDAPSTRRRLWSRRRRCPARRSEPLPPPPHAGTGDRQRRGSGHRLPAPVVRSGPRFATPDADIRPPYPEVEARAGARKRCCSLRLSIDERGRVVAVEPVGQADPAFLAAARRHILKAWRYQPAMEGDQAVAATHRHHAEVRARLTGWPAGVAATPPPPYLCRMPVLPPVSKPAPPGATCAPSCASAAASS